jgi:DNA-directed RNA polymerase beta subunit
METLSTHERLSENYVWNILRDYFETEGFVSHQIQTFDDYLKNGIPRVVQESDIVINQKDLKYRVSFGEVYIPTPQIMDEKNRKLRNLYPYEARIKDLNYDSPIFVNITEYIEMEGEEPETIVHKRVNIGRTPIMLRSEKCNLKYLTKSERVKEGECDYDTGGYFIIKGKERVLVGQLRGVYNLPIVIAQKPGDKYKYVCEVRSMSEETGHSVLLQVKIGSEENRDIVFSLPNIKEVIPVGVVFKALGYTSDEEIINIIGNNNVVNAKYLKYIVRDSKFIETQNDALRYIGQYSIHVIKEEKREEYASQIVENELLPHMGITSTIKEKTYYLGYMVSKLLDTISGLRKEDDRDNYINKRVEMAGVLCCDLFRTLFKRYVKNIQGQLEKKKQRPDVMSIILRTTSITMGLKHAFSTGNWGVQKNSYIRTGVSQVLARMNYGSTLSHLRRVVIPIGKEGKNAKIRQTHQSQIMYLCPNETPEGQSIGIVLNLSLLTKVTKRIPTVVVKEIIEDCKNFVFINDYEGKNVFPKIFVNGALMGITKNPFEFIKELHQHRKNGLIDKTISFTFNELENVIKIFSDEGRFIRPVFTVNEKNTLNINEKDKICWADFVENEHIVYIDNCEAENSVIAMDQNELTKFRANYCEICPAMMMGVMSNGIPFSDHSQSPRNIYQCLDPNTTVLLIDGNKKAIKDIKIGDEVLTFNPETMEISNTKVIHQYVRPTENDIYKITTISGREIIATGNHNFMTNDGWCPVEKMDLNKTKIGILMNPLPMTNNIIKRELILSSEQMRVKLKGIIKDSLIELHIKKLENIGLLPLYNDNSKLHIISRIYGFLCTDGSINVYNKKNGGLTGQCQFDFGTELDSLYFENDVEFLGIERCTPKESFSEYDGSIYHTWCVSHNGELPSFFIALGISFEKKTETPRNEIPDWIMNGSDNVKREFLAGFQGGDGCQIRWNKLKNRDSYNFVCAETSQSINPIYYDLMEIFFKQCVTLLKYFDIEAKYLDPVQYEENRYRFAFKISDTQENLIKYYDTIGYRYAYYKIVNSGKVIEYLKYKDIIVKNHIKFVENVRNEIDIGFTNSEIVKKYNLKTSNISDIRRSYKDGRQISSPNLFKYNIKIFLESITDKSTSLFIPIKSIEKLPNQLISDITVESDNHSFIAGDNFLSSNSSMGKQAIGVYALSHQLRTDTITHVLNYPQKPLVNTLPAKFMGFDDLPMGMNVIVAIMTYGGWNQEDSVIINKSAIERGLFVSTSYRTLVDEEKKQGTYNYETICLPPIEKRKRNSNYSFLDENGLVKKYMNGKNIYVDKGDVIIGKILTKSNKSGEEEIFDNSYIIKSGEEGYIDRVIETVTPNGYKMVKVVVRHECIPEIGDKFASRAAQKGTLGMIYSQENMPFTQDGIVPDLILNPLALPSQ